MPASALDFNDPNFDPDEMTAGVVLEASEQELAVAPPATRVRLAPALSWAAERGGRGRRQTCEGAYVRPPL